MDIREVSTKVDSHLDSLVADCPDVIGKLVRLGVSKNDDLVEIVTVLPAAMDISVNIGLVQRWRSISEYFECPIRVYGWSYNTDVEKCLLSLVQEHSDIFLTVLPGELKGAKSYA